MGAIDKLGMPSYEAAEDASTNEDQIKLYKPEKPNTDGDGLQYFDDEPYREHTRTVDEELAAIFNAEREVLDRVLASRRVEVTAKRTTISEIGEAEKEVWPTY